MAFQNYEILLFAEDVVSYLMNTKLMWRQTGFCSSDVAPRAGEYRHVVYNGFSEIVRKAVDVLYETHFFSIQKQYNKIVQTSEIDDESLKKYAKFLWEQHFSDGIDAIRFLRFCVVLTALAGAFYLEGFKKSPDYAVQIIVYHFPRADCLKVTWNVLSRAALHYLKEKTGKSYSQIFDNLDDDLPSCMDFKNGYTCNCFKIDLKGASFKKIYAMRENVLRCHFIICLKANFGEVLNQNYIRPADYKTECDTYIPSVSNMEDKHFSGNQSSMSAIHKISQAARLSEKSSSNYNHTISRNNEIIPSNHESHTDMSSVLKISRSDKCPEKSSDTLSQSSAKDITKQTNHQRNSVIFKNSKSFKRFKMCDSGNIDNNKVIPLKSDLNNYPTYHSHANPIAKLSEMFLNLESMSDKGNVYNGNRISPRKSDLNNYPTHLTASYHTAKLSEKFQNMEYMPYSRNVNNGNKVIPLKSDLYGDQTHQPDNHLIANPSEMFQDVESMYDHGGNVSNGNRLSPLISDFHNDPTHAKLSERFQNMESMSDSRNVNTGNKVIPLKSDLYDYPNHEPDNHPMMKLSEMFQNIESILSNIRQ